jgi:hypothetical protein
MLSGALLKQPYFFCVTELVRLCIKVPDDGGRVFAKGGENFLELALSIKGATESQAGVFAEQ